MRNTLMRIVRYWGVFSFGGLAVALFLAGQLVSVEEDPQVRREPQTVTLELGLPEGSEALTGRHTFRGTATATDLEYREWMRRAAAGEFSKVYYALGIRYRSDDSSFGINVYGSRRDTSVLDYAFRQIDLETPENHREVKRGVEGSCYVIHTEYDPEARFWVRNVLRGAATPFAIAAVGFLVVYSVRALYRFRRKLRRS